MIPYYSWTTILLGPLTIQVWGLFVSLGILFSLWIVKKRSTNKPYPVELIYDLFFWSLIGGFVGARLGHIFFYEPIFFIAHPIEALKVWHGGLSSFGGFVGAGIGFFFYAKNKKLSREILALVANELGFAAVFGWMIGRVGCAMIHDHWGVPCNCPLAIATPSGGRLDMAVLEIIALIPLAIWLFIKRNSQKYSQKFLPIISVYYGVLRFVLDFFRATDLSGADVRYLGLTPGQYFAIVLVGLGIYKLREDFQVYLNKRHYVNILKKENFTHVFSWYDAPNTVYDTHTHKGRVSFFVVYGSVIFSGGIDKKVQTGERFDVPIGVSHSAIAGAEGCYWVVGEDIKGDS